MENNIWKNIAKELQEALVLEINEHTGTKTNLDDVTRLVADMAVLSIKQQGVIEYLEDIVFDQDDDNDDEDNAEDNIFPVEDSE
jgi:hypothetical protein